MATQGNVTLTPYAEVLSKSEEVMVSLEASGDMSGMPYYRVNEVMILTDTHAISVWNDGPNEGVKVAHRALGAPEWKDGTP